MKILLTGKNYPNLKRGAHLIGNKFGDLFPEIFDYIDQKEVTNWKEISEKYKKIVFLTQDLHVYNTPPHAPRIYDIPHTFYIRNEYIHPLINTCSNGFNYFNQFPGIKNYIPRIIPPPLTSDKRTSDRPCIGFYLRAEVYTDSYKNFVNFVENLKEEVDIYILGEDRYNFGIYPHVKNYHQTFDNSEFFSNITHFVYYHSSKLDPFTHTLLEAVLLNKQIIIPNERPTDFKDGVDDIKDVADFHTHLDLNKTFDNSKCLMTFENLLPWYKEVFNDYNHNLPHNKYHSLQEFLEKEVLPLH